MDHATTANLRLAADDRCRRHAWVYDFDDNQFDDNQFDDEHYQHNYHDDDDDNNDNHHKHYEHDNDHHDDNRSVWRGNVSVELVPDAECLVAVLALLHRLLRVSVSRRLRYGALRGGHGQLCAGRNHNHRPRLRCVDSVLILNNPQKKEKSNEYTR